MWNTKTRPRPRTLGPFSRWAGQGTLRLQDSTEVIWLDTGIASKETRPWAPEPLTHPSQPALQNTQQQLPTGEAASLVSAKAPPMVLLSPALACFIASSFLGLCMNVCAYMCVHVCACVSVCVTSKHIFWVHPLTPYLPQD